MLVSAKIKIDKRFKDMEIVEFKHGIVHVHSDFLNNFSGKVATIMQLILDDNEDYRLVSMAHMPGEGFNAIIKFEEKCFGAI